MYENARHNWQLRKNQTGISTYNCSVFKGCSYHKNTMSEWKAVLEMTTVHPDTAERWRCHWCTAAAMTAWKRHLEWRHTSSLRSLVQLVMAPFIFFSVALNVKMNYARNYKNLLNFVKVMPKILVVPFFPDTVYIAFHDYRYRLSHL